MKRSLKTGKVCLMVLLGLVSGKALAQTTQTNGRAVSLGTDGSIRIEPKKEKEIAYTPTGLLVTDEAEKYPEAIKQLVKEGKTTSPLATRLVNSRMTGLLTWRRTQEVTSLLVNEGGVIQVRSANSIAEKAETNQDFSNPFGLLALVFFGLLALANLLLKKGSESTAFVAAAFAFAFAFAAAAFAAVAFAAAATAFVAAATAFVAAAFAAVATDNKNVKVFRWSSGIAAGAMIVAVILAV